jgi:hypothetical protein
MKRLVGWLAECETQTKLYFWRCLLFSNEQDVWNTQGVLELNLSLGAQQKHPKLQTRVSCYLQLKLFQKQQKFDLLDAKSRIDVTEHDKQVKKNGVTLCRFTVAVCSLAK